MHNKNTIIDKIKPPIEQIEKYQKKLTEFQNFIEVNKNKLKIEEINEEFKKKLFDVILQTMSILEAYY